MRVLNSCITDFSKLFLISVNMNEFAMVVVQCFEKYTFFVYELQVLM